MTRQNLEYFLLGALGGAVLGAAVITLLESLAPVLFGWPFILLAILALAGGIQSRKVVLVLLGAFLSAPFSLYLAATPRFRLVGALLPLLHLAAAYAVNRNLRWLAWLLVLPYLAIIAWIGWGVLIQ